MHLSSDDFIQEFWKEMMPLITISSHDFDSNIHRIQTSMKKLKKCHV